MFSVITNIYNKKTKGPTLMELFAATGKLKCFFLQLEMFDVCTAGDTADVQVLTIHASTWVHISNISSCQKKLFQFSCGCEPLR
jgi:hypothetical protein